jgi:hypothetical protein
MYCTIQYIGRAVHYHLRQRGGRITWTKGWDRESVSLGCLLLGSAPSDESIVQSPMHSAIVFALCGGGNLAQVLSPLRLQHCPDTPRHALYYPSRDNGVQFPIGVLRRVVTSLHRTPHTMCCDTTTGYRQRVRPPAQIGQGKCMLHPCCVCQPLASGW